MYRVKLLSCINAIPLAYQQILISRVHWLAKKYIKDQRIDPFVIPLKYSLRNTITGAPDQPITEQEQAQIQFDLETIKRFFEGPFYLTHNQQVYDPSLLKLNQKRCFNVFGLQSGDEADCLINAFNYLIGEPYFTHREQIMRLLNRKTHKTIDRLRDMRISQGVPATAFKDMGVHEGLAYSLVEVITTDQTSYHWLINTLFKQMMLGPDAVYDRVIVAGLFMVDGVARTHAFTCIVHKGKGKKIKIYDSLFKNLRWYPKDQTGLGSTVDSYKDFNRYQQYRVYELQARVVTPKVAE